MGLRTEARRLQLKTNIVELGRQTRSYNVKSVATRMNEQLAILQEEYKSLTGEYIKEWMPLKEAETVNEEKRDHCIVIVGDNVVHNGSEESCKKKFDELPKGIKPSNVRMMFKLVKEDKI